MKRVTLIFIILTFFIGCASTIQTPQSEVIFLESKSDEAKFSLGFNSFLSLNAQEDIDKETVRRYRVSNGDSDDLYAAKFRGFGVSTNYLLNPKLSASITLGSLFGIDISTLISNRNYLTFVLNAQGSSEIFFHHILIKSKHITFASGPYYRYDKFWVSDYQNHGDPDIRLGPTDYFSSYSYGIRCVSQFKKKEQKGTMLLNANTHIGYSKLFKKWHLLLGLNIVVH